jgi:hypothetical protein
MVAPSRVGNFRFDLNATTVGIGEVITRSAARRFLKAKHQMRVSFAWSVAVLAVVFFQNFDRIKYALKRGVWLYVRVGRALHDVIHECLLSAFLTAHKRWRQRSTVQTEFRVIDLQTTNPKISFRTKNLPKTGNLLLERMTINGFQPLFQAESSARYDQRPLTASDLSQ